MPDEADIETLNDAIVTAAQNPKSATIDGNSVTSHSLDELIKASNHVASTVAASHAHRGLRFTILVPPGCG